VSGDAPDDGESKGRAEGECESGARENRDGDWRWYLEHAVGREVDVHGEDAHVLGLRRHLSSSSHADAAAARKTADSPGACMQTV